MITIAKPRISPNALRALGIAGASLFLATLGGCATAAKFTLEDRLAALGLPSGQAACMADQLDERLDSQDLQDLARYTLTLSRAQSPGGVLDALLQFDNPRAVVAIGQSGLSCAFAPRG